MASPSQTAEQGTGSLGLQESLPDLHAMIQQALDGAAKSLVATVTAVGGAGTINDGKVKIQPVGASSPIDVFWPVISGGYDPQVGDTVRYLPEPGGNAVVLGRRSRPGDRDIAGLSGDINGLNGNVAVLTNNKLERNGTQSMTGPLLLPGDPTYALHAATKGYTDNADNARTYRGGDTMWGPLTLSGNPVNPLHASTKQYTDAVGQNAQSGAQSYASSVANTAQSNAQGYANQYKFPFSGGTITGNTYIKGAQLQADSMFLNFGGLKAVKRDTNGYLWC